MSRYEPPVLARRSFKLVVLLCAVIPPFALTQSVATNPRVAGMPATASSTDLPALGLAPLERAYIAKQLATHQERVRLLIAAREGRSVDVRSQLQAIGAPIGLFDAELDFIVAQVPIARLREVLAWPDILAAEIEVPLQGALFRYDRPADPAAGAPPSAMPPPPGPPLSVTGEAASIHTGEHVTEARAFKTAHPTYDGRGVVVGGLETLNPLTPTLARATALDGSPVPKVVDYLMLPPAEVKTPAIPAPGRTAYVDWQKTVAVKPTTDRRVVFNHQRYRLPANIEAGEWRMALLRTPDEAKPNEFALLWHVERRAIWISSRELADFDKGVALALPSHTPHAAATSFLTPDSERSIRVATDLPTRAVGVELDWATHGTMCATLATGNGAQDGRLDGAAPGAQYLVTDGPLWSKTNDENPEEIGIEPLIALFRNPRVDLITYSGGVSPGSGRRRLPDQRRAGTRILGRLIARYPKPLFVGAGNGKPTFPVDGPMSTEGGAITIGGYAPTDTWRANIGVTPTERNTLAPYSTPGPTWDGRLKPELVALTGTIATVSRAPNSWFWESPFLPLSRSYLLSSGTSAAAPNAAGHAALLISAAKQAGIPWDLHRLKVALYSTARFLDGVDAFRQGHGLIQVAQAWAALQRLRDNPPPTFVTQAPLKTFFSGQLATPDVGQGLFEMIGWRPGQYGERTLTITRTSGPDTPITYALRWHGDTTAFTSPVESLTLPLNRPVELPVRIQIRDSGSYSAIVDLIDPALNLTVHSVLCTIVAAEQFTPAHDYSVVVTRTVPHPGHGMVYLNVPVGTTALRVQVNQQHGKRVSLNIDMPDGRTAIDPFAPIRDHSQTTWEVRPSDRASYDQTFADPMPGVWTLWVTHDNGWSPTTYDPTDTHPAQPAEFTLRATAIRFDSTVATASGHSPAGAVVTFRSALAPVDRPVMKLLGVGVGQTHETTLQPGLTPALYPVNVPADADLEVSVEPVDATASDISLLVWRSTSRDDRSALNVVMELSPGSTKHVVLPRLAAGRYVVGLNAWGNVPNEGVRVRYRQAVLRRRHDPISCLQPCDELSASVPKVSGVRVRDDEDLVARFGVFAEDIVNTPNPEPLSANPKKTQRKPLVSALKPQPVPIASSTIVISPARHPRLAPQLIPTETRASALRKTADPR